MRAGRRADSRARVALARAMEAYRRAQRKKEVAKNKAARREARERAADASSVKELEDELERLRRAESVPGARVDRLRDKAAWLAKRVEEKRASGRVDGSGARRAVPASRAHAVGATAARRPEDSAYYHPTLNPTGRPPAGKPWKWRDGVGGSGVVDASRALPGIGAGGGSESESDDAPGPPPGPPPGFELVIPDAPVARGGVGAVVDEDEDDALPPPPVPPPSEGGEDDDDDDALPPPPMPPSGSAEENDDDALPPPPIPPPRVVETTTIVYRAPVGSMPRPPPPQRRPPKSNDGFFAAPRAAPAPKPVDPSAFTKSAAPTAKPIVRAEHNTALKALVPASVRVKRQGPPEAKRPRIDAGRAINAAPSVQDEKYLSFLDEMADLGAFAE